MHDAASDHSSYWIQLIHHTPASVADKLSYWRDIREHWIASIDLPPENALLLGSAQEMQSKHHQLTMFYDELMIASAGYIEDILEQKGYGRPPAAYAFIQFGSGGRKEMTLWSDQDHGLMWANTESADSDRVEQYFTVWGQQYSDLMLALRFPPCNGNVLATNPEWRGGLLQWIERTKHWMMNLDWEHMRTFTMALDMRTIYGDPQLEEQWRCALKSLQGDQHGPISQAIISNLLHRKRAQNSFGQLIRERYGEDAGLFDVKYRLYVPIAQMTRATMWLFGIYDPHYSTSERMTCLLDMPIPNDLKLIIEEVNTNWHVVLTLRFIAKGRLEQDSWQSSGMVNLDQLTVEIKQAIMRTSQSSMKWMRWLGRRGGHER